MNGEELVIYGLTGGAVGLVARASYPAVFRLFWEPLANKVDKYQQGKVERATKMLDDIFVEVKPLWLKAFYVLTPIVAGVALLLIFNNILVACVGVVLGIIVPDLWLKWTNARRKKKFGSQLVDALLILSSSLKAGLSLPQAFEVVEAEMPPPSSQEFGLVVKAHRLGRTLEQALTSLSDRMPSEELHLITTAVLVARETGGDITQIITQLVMMIREKKKLTDKVDTLTLQGRLQAYIISCLPVVFALFVRTFQPGYFDPMLREPRGNFLIALAVGLWLIGITLLIKLSKVDV